MGCNSIIQTQTKGITLCKLRNVCHSDVTLNFCSMVNLNRWGYVQEGFVSVLAHKIHFSIVQQASPLLRFCVPARLYYLLIYEHDKLMMGFQVLTTVKIHVVVFIMKTVKACSPPPPQKKKKLASTKHCVLQTQDNNFNHESVFFF
jgi:hypothetical protein